MDTANARSGGSEDVARDWLIRQALRRASAVVQRGFGSFVWRPGAPTPTPPGVYADFPSLAAALAQVPGLKEVEVDPRFAPAVVPPGVWTLSDLCDVTFVGTNVAEAAGTFTQMTISDGASFPANDAPTCIARFFNLSVAMPVSAPAITLSDGVNPGNARGVVFQLENASIDTTGATAAPFIARGTGTFSELQLINNAQFFPANSPALDAEDTSFVILFCGPNGLVPDNCLITSPGGAIGLGVSGAAASVSLFQAGAPGLSPSYASQLDYLTANRVFGQVAALAAQPPSTAGILAAPMIIRRRSLGKYKLAWTIDASNAAPGPMVLTLQAASTAGGLPASGVLTRSITVPGAGDGVEYSGLLIFDGSPNSPNGGALLPADAAGNTFVDFAITVGGGAYTTTTQAGVVSLEEVG